MIFHPCERKIEWDHGRRIPPTLDGAGPGKKVGLDTHLVGKTDRQRAKIRHHDVVTKSSEALLVKPGIEVAIDIFVTANISVIGRRPGRAQSSLGFHIIKKAILVLQAALQVQRRVVHRQDLILPLNVGREVKFTGRGRIAFLRIIMVQKVYGVGSEIEMAVMEDTVQSAVLSLAVGGH